MAVVKLSPVTATKADPVTVAVPKVVVKLSPVTRTVAAPEATTLF
jgi:hypothetical protein